MSDLKSRFGQRLAHIRRQKGMTQDQLAGVLGCELSTISKMERGIHGPRFPLFEQIVDILETHPREFFDFEWHGRL